jgi:hypothetical protein
MHTTSGLGGLLEVPSIGWLHRHEIHEQVVENFNFAVEGEQVLQPLGDPAHMEAETNPLLNIDVEYSDGHSSC